MKKILSIILAICLLILTFSACAEKNTNLTYGAQIDKDTLRICIDVESSDVIRPDRSAINIEYRNFVEQIKKGIGMKNIALEIVPSDGEEREGTLTRLRTEIMSGGGPDVFILGSTGSLSGSHLRGYAYDTTLLNYPEKSMENSLFLPLDEYIENNTQFTDWDAQTKAVLDAGRTAEGQVVIPLTYSFPLTVYPRDEVTIPYTTELSMQDVLENPETAGLGAVLYTSLSGTNYDGVESGRAIAVERLPYLLGKLANYEQEELLFTEEDLYEVLSSMHSLHNAVEENEQPSITNYNMAFSIDLIRKAQFETDMALVPHYSQNGGVTASVQSYAAVNRNTRFPEEAFAVIDYIMQEEMQMQSQLYSELIRLGGDFTLQNDLGLEEKPLCGQNYFSPEMYNDLMQIKNQITAVNFRSELDITLEILAEETLTQKLRAAEDNASLGISSADYVLPKEEVSETYDILKRMVGE